MPRYKRKSTKRKYRAKSKRSTRKRKPSKKVVAARKKAKAKRVRRVKLINKTIRRVQTKLADEKGCMYRKKLTSIQSNQLPTGNTEGNGQLEAYLDQLGQVNDGDFVKRDIFGVMLSQQDFFTINDFHGICMPKWSQGQDALNLTTDPNWEKLTTTGLYVPQDRVGFAPVLGQNDDRMIDIRAMRTLKLPFIPCIPKFIDENVGQAVTQVAQRWRHNELDKFARKGDRIKILNNYFRFKFWVRPDNNGVRCVYDAGTNNSTTTYTATSIGIEPTNYNSIHPPCNTLGIVAPPPAVGTIVSTPGTSGSLTAVVNPGQNINPGQISWNNLVGTTKTPANRAKSFVLTTPPSAKVRIIVVSRENIDNRPIFIDEFLKEAADYSMADEGYRMDKFFHRKKKTERDIFRWMESGPAVLDAQGHLVIPSNDNTSMNLQRRLADVRFVHDKVYNLKEGFNMIRLNLLKGKVLEYEPSDPTLIGIQGGAQTIPLTLGGPPPTTNDNGQAVGEDIVPEGNAGSTFTLPISTEAVLETLATTDMDGRRSNAVRNEYCYKGRQYAMFMMVKNIRCSSEWEIFQKFEYDK